MRTRTPSETFKSTVLPYQPNSCQNCWNRPKTQADDELAPRYHGIYTSIPVHLVEIDGTITLIGYRAQCLTCGAVRWYEGLGCVYKLGERVDFKAECWPEVRRNGLDAEGFHRAVFENPQERYFEASKLPKYESVRHRAEFYEPKSERCDFYEQEGF